MIEKMIFMKRIFLTLIFMMGLAMCWGQETVSDSTSKKKDEHSLNIYLEVRGSGWALWQAHRCGHHVSTWI